MNLPIITAKLIYKSWLYNISVPPISRMIQGIGRFSSTEIFRCFLGQTFPYAAHKRR